MLQFVSLMCDTEALCRVFTQLGFVTEVHNNLTAEGMRREIQALSKRNFYSHDVLVSSVTNLHSSNSSQLQVYIFEKIDFTLVSVP